MKILITGASGVLGSELRKIFPKAICPTESELDVTDFDDVITSINLHKPDVVIHCAAMTNVSECERRPFRCYNINVIGTQNIVKVCDDLDIKMVYISTDHVFDGTSTLYTEKDTPNPQGVYARSKLMGEWFTLANPKNLVIRTCFMKTFPFEKAYTDKYFNAEKVEKIAEWIAKAVVDDLKGIWHIAGFRKSIYDFAKRLNPSVKPMLLKDRPLNPDGILYLKDPSMDVSKWMEYLEKS